MLFWNSIKLALEKRKVNKFLQNISIDNVDALDGYDFEVLTSVLLKNCGFKCKLTPKSKDYGVDILASKNGLTLAVQTKLYYNHSVGNKGVQEAFSGKKYFDANIAVLITNSIFTKNAVNSAKKLNVMLLGREELCALISGTPKQNSQLFDKWIYENLKGKMDETS